MGRDVAQSRAFRRSQRFKNVAAAFGFRVRRLRKDQGWTLETASAKMGLDLRHLQQIETGTVNVTLATILRICDAFDVSPFVLLPRARETKPELGPVRVRTFGVIGVAEEPEFRPRHPGQVMDNPSEPLPATEFINSKKRVGAAIQRARKLKGWTQAKLAKAMGVAVQQVQNVEGGRANMQIDSIVKYAKVLDVTPKEFWW